MTPKAKNKKRKERNWRWSGDGSQQRPSSLWVAFSIILVVILAGMCFYHFVEWLSWFDSFYFVLITMSTIGYGDIVPQTHGGKLVAIFYAFSWVPLFIYTMWLFVERRLRSTVHHYVKHSTHQAVKAMSKKIAKIEKEKEAELEQKPIHRVKAFVWSLSLKAKNLMKNPFKRQASDFDLDEDIDTDTKETIKG